MSLSDRLERRLTEVLREEMAVYRTQLPGDVASALMYAALGGHTRDMRLIDLDGEAAILSAILCGHVAARDFPALRPEHFYAEINQRAFRALLKLPGDADGELHNALAEKAARAGFEGDISGYFLMLRDAIPFVDTKRLRGVAIKIADLHARRVTVGLLEDIQENIRCSSFNQLEMVVFIESVRSAYAALGLHDVEAPPAESASPLPGSSRSAE